MIEIRPYRDEDRAATARLWMASWRSTGLSVALEPAETELYALSHQRIVCELAAEWVVHLAWEDGKLVGFLALKPQAGCLDQIFVLPEAQDQGIGRALLDFAKARLPDGIWLRTLKANVRACRFYERNGFTPGESEPHPVLGHPTIIYRWP
jgi:ribosomal protein S18 acetylase RimI-like enzyme